MARLNINIGTTANDRTGDPLRAAFEKVNSNFIELYTSSTQVQSDWNAVTGLGVILNKPTIPAAQVQSDWNAVTGLGVILNKPTILTSLDRLTNGSNVVVLGSSGTLTLPLSGTIDNYLDITTSQSIELTPNNLSQTTATIIVDKNGPPNAQWATVQVGWTITVGLVTRTVASITEELTTVSFVLNGTVALPMTGSVIFQSLGTPSLAITPNGTTAWTFSSDGALSYPNGALQQDTGAINCQGNASTVVFTATGVSVHTIRLLIQVEGIEGIGSIMDTQACEMIVAKSFRADDIAASVYGIVYTSVAPLATFTALWNGLTSRIEVLCTTPGANGVNVKIFATEITTSD